MRAISEYNGNSVPRVVAQSSTDPVLRALLHTTKQSTQQQIAPSYIKKNINHNNAILTSSVSPSRSYSNQRSTSNHSPASGNCELPRLCRSNSAQIFLKSLENNNAPKTKLIHVCTSPGKSVKSLQKYSVFDQLSTDHNIPKTDIQLPPIQALAARRSKSNPESTKNAIVSNSLISNKNQSIIENRCYQTLYADTKNQIVYGYSMSPHPERDGGFRRAHCPIGDLVRESENMKIN